MEDRIICLAHGNSMYPTICHGDTLIVKKGVSDIDINQIVLYNKKIKIILIGFSDGARNAIQATKNINIDGLILWNPIFNVPITSITSIHSKKEKFTFHPLYKIPIKKLLGVGLSVDMIKQIEAENAIDAFEDYKNNILLLFGEKDKLTQNVNNHLTNKDLISRNNVDYVIVKNADHLFNKAAYVDEVFDTTINWVIYNFGEKSEKRK